jgi:hypothetical protein
MYLQRPQSSAEALQHRLSFSIITEEKRSVLLAAAAPTNAATAKSRLPGKLQ